MYTLACSKCWDPGTCLPYRIQGFLHFAGFYCTQTCKCTRDQMKCSQYCRLVPIQSCQLVSTFQLAQIFIYILYLEYLAFYILLLVHTAKNEIIYHDFFGASCIAKYRQHSSIGQIGVHNKVRCPRENLWNVDTSLQLTLSERNICKDDNRVHTVIVTSEQASHYIMWF